MDNEKEIEELALMIVAATAPLGVKDLTQQFGYKVVAEYLFNGGYRKQQTCNWYEAKPDWYGFVEWGCDNCGDGFVFEEGGPTENNMHYCPYCGARIVKVIPLQNDGEDE